MSSQLFEPSYVFNPCGEIPLITLRERRCWHVKAQLLHYEPGRETWEFAVGDLVRHFGEPETTIGTIVGTKWSEQGGHITGEKYELYDVVWGDHGPSSIQRTEIKATTRKLRAKWSAEPAPDLTSFKLPEDWFK